MLTMEGKGLCRQILNCIGVTCIEGICLLVFAGCAVGPDFRPPKTHIPAKWSGLVASPVSPTQITVAQSAELVDWWRSFDDPILNSLVERAVESNLDLRQAGSRIRQARASRGVAASGLWPQIDANASYRRSRSGSSSSVSSGMSNRQDSSTSSLGTSSDSQNLFQVGLDAAWELDFFGGVRRDIEASQADIQASVEDRRDVLVTLVAEVGTNYVNLRGLQQQIDIALRNLQAQQHNAEITRRRFEAGFVSALDVVNAEAQLATTESQIPVFESEAQTTIYSLSVLLALEPSALVQELTIGAPIPLTPPEVPVGLPSDLLRRRPDIRRAEAQIHAATARVGVATADLFPKFSLTGSFGHFSTDLGSLGNSASRFWSMGPTVSWPIFEAGRIRSNIKIQDALQEQSLLALESTILTALKDVETALIAYAKELQHRELLIRAVENNRKAVDLSMKLYVAGRTDFLNVISAQRLLYESEDALTKSTMNLTTDLIALYKALGGGWSKDS